MSDITPGIDYIGVATPFFCHDGNGNFVLQKCAHTARDEHGRWDFGGGKLEFDLSLEENVRKEVAEEYGVTDIHIQNQLPAHSYGTTHNEHTAHWIIIGFFVNVNPQKVVNNEPHKIETIEWFRLQQLPSPLHTGLQNTVHWYWSYFLAYA